LNLWKRRHRTDWFEGATEPGNKQQWHLPVLQASRKQVARGQSKVRKNSSKPEKKGLNFIPQRGAKCFIGENGRLKAVEFIGVKRTYDDKGRFNPQPDPSLSETLEADSVIPAIGQQADLPFLKLEDGVELTLGGTIKVDRTILAITAPGLFAGGDVAFGPRNLIEAVANGNRVALSIDDHLRGRKAKSANFCSAFHQEMQGCLLVKSK
jgi:NADPH-dependent glutamate synthase beta subunit-like oxidoreductase